MINTIFGIKSKMTQTFVGDERVSVTVVKVTPNFVTQVKTSDKDGYVAVQLATGSKKEKNITKPLKGHLKGAIVNKIAPKFLREIRVVESDLKQGDKVAVTDVLSVGDSIVVTGTSKGKGFAGGVKRWGFAGGPKTHGQSDRHRAPGSIGQGTTPGRVYKGKHMAGRMGSDTKTIKNLQVVEVNEQTNEIMIKGGIPGSVGTLIKIVRIGEMKNPVMAADEQVTPEAETIETQEVVETAAQEPQEQPTNEVVVEQEAQTAAPEAVEETKQEENSEVTEEVKENENA